MRRALCLDFMIAMAFAAGMARAQAPARPLPPVDSAIVTIRLVDGAEVMGRVTARDDSSLTLATTNAVRMVIPLGAIASWRRGAGQLVGGQFRPGDPHATRLFFGPTARTLPAGEGYFADYFLFFPMVGFGVTDYLTLAAGISIVPGVDEQIVYFAPKVRVAHGPKFSASVGGILFTLTGGGGQAGAAYGAVTLGDENNAVTLLAGLTEVDGRFSSTPGFLIGGETRLGRGTKLMAEVWAFPAGDFVPAIAGLRFFGSRVAVDFGFMYPIGAGISEGWPLIPWVDFAVHF
jgi:hypothetical protein